MGTSRRTFLKVGGLGALALAVAGTIYRASRTSTAQPFVLDGAARAALDAIIPAVLAGALPADAATRPDAVRATIGHVHAAIGGLPLATQQEVQDLFALLALAPARRLLAGVPDGWESASMEQVTAFLHAWQMHRLGLLRSAYQALHDLVLGAWYADPASWAAIGYPGPVPELAGATA